jgi:hypothetical protein
VAATVPTVTTAKMCSSIILAAPSIICSNKREIQNVQREREREREREVQIKKKRGEVQKITCE